MESDWILFLELSQFRDRMQEEIGRKRHDMTKTCKLVLFQKDCSSVIIVCCVMSVTLVMPLNATDVSNDGERLSSIQDTCLGCCQEYIEKKKEHQQVVR
jgi:hypothetical protein